MTRSSEHGRPSATLPAVWLLVIFAGAILLVSPGYAAPDGITVNVVGGESHSLGEQLVFTGQNVKGNATYLFIVGQNLPADGGKPTAPFQGVVSGEPDTFAVAPVNEDGSWSYSLFTSPLGVATGIYTVYAVSGPAGQRDLAGVTYNTTTIILEEPVVTAEIASSPVKKGDRFVVTGRVKEYPDTVHVWILGNNFVYNVSTPVNPDKTFSQKIDTKTSENLPAGQCYLIVQHPRGADLYNVYLDGDWVYGMTEQGNAQRLFKIRGTGSLQGRDAAEALIASFADIGKDDSYTVIPLSVNSSHITQYELVETPDLPGRMPVTPYATMRSGPLTLAPAITPAETPAPPVATTPERTQVAPPATTRAATISFAVIGAFVLAAGIALLDRKS